MVLDLYTFDKFKNTLKYSNSDNNIYNISYIKSFNDSVKNYTCIYYTEKNENNNNDIIINIDIKKYEENENLHKYCTYKYLKSYNSNNNLIIIIIILFTVWYFCIYRQGHNVF